jgi:hypothetical protein
MARSTTTIESVWAAKGNQPDNAIVATADGKYPALDGSLITNVGDLLAANNLSELTATASVARTNLELGETDTVEFGTVIPPTGTTAEIDAVFSGSHAVPDAIYFDRDTKQLWQALTNSTRQLVSPSVPSFGVINADNIAVDSTADVAFSSDTIDFDLSTLVVGESATFDIELYFQIQHTGVNFPLTSLHMDTEVRSDIGSLGFGFPAFPLKLDNFGSLIGNDTTNFTASSANGQPLGGFGTTNINGASYPYNKSSVTLASIEDTSGSSATYLVYASKQRVTFTRTSTDFPVSYPMRVSFRVKTAATSPETVSFAKSNIWWRRIDV